MAFFDNGNPITDSGGSNVAVINGQAVLILNPPLPVGSHTITAVYGGSGNYNSSTSAGYLQTVTSGTANSVALAASTSGNPAVFGEPVTFTATVTGAAGTPTGTVTFRNVTGGNTITLGTSTLNATGQAQFTTDAINLLSPANSITAVYSGDTTYARTTSPAVSQTVTQAATSISNFTFPGDAPVFSQPFSFQRRRLPRRLRSPRFRRIQTS